MRRAAKVDGNQGEIVEALRKAGCSVQCLHAVGGGVPDLLVGRKTYFGAGRTNLLLEVKDGRLSPSRRQLTPEQEDWHAEWRGSVVVVTSVEEALRAVGAIP